MLQQHLWQAEDVHFLQSILNRVLHRERERERDVARNISPLHAMHRESAVQGCIVDFPEADILKMGILGCVPLPTFRHPTSQSKMSGLEIFPHPTCEVKGSGDWECLHPISHMASEKWEVGIERGFPFLKYPTLARFVFRVQKRWTFLQGRQIHLSPSSCRVSHLKRSTYKNRVNDRREFIGYRNPAQHQKNAFSQPFTT